MSSARRASNPDCCNRDACSHHAESNALPTELRDRHGLMKGLTKSDGRVFLSQQLNLMCLPATQLGMCQELLSAALLGTIGAC